MNEIATREDHAAAVPTGQQQPEMSALAKWAEEARIVSNIAVSIARTSFAGALRGKPEEVTAVILAGTELGLKPMAALKSIDIIQGTPALRAHAMRGLVQSHGHQIQLVESTPEKCVMRGRRKGEEDWQEVEWDLNRARLLGLTGKPEWKKQPKTMLVARTTGELCRLIASDALHGMPYAAEELDAAPKYTVTRAPRLTVDELVGAPAEPAADDADAWEPENEDDKAANAAVGPDNPGTDPWAAWPETAVPGAQQ